MNEIEETIKDRRKKYGSFRVFANYLNELRNSADFESTDLNEWQVAAIDMIFVKIARILNGNPNLIDNWHDIAGYARLVEIELQKEEMRVK